MRNVGSVIVGWGSALCLVLCAGCSAAVGETGEPTIAPHAYGGTYEVPTVTAELANAALYPVAEVEWTVANGTAKLDYALPLGLVGKELRVEFVGPMAASATSASLTGPAGSAECTVSGTTIACLEHMAGLLPIEPDMAVIEQLAAVEYGGPAAHRVEVAKQFATDPIGIVRFDAGAPVDPHEAEEPHEPEDDG